MLLTSIENSVKVQNVFVPRQGLQKVLGAFSFNLLIWNHDSSYEVSLLGSASPIRYRGHYFLLCTRHQIKDVNTKDIGIHTGDAGRVVTSSDFTTIEIGPAGQETDLEDIVAFGFDRACQMNPHLKSRFFDIGDTVANFDENETVEILNSGYPTSVQDYDVYASQHVTFRRRSTMLKTDGSTNDETVCRLKM